MGSKQPRTIYFPDSKLAVVVPKSDSKFECSIHFPRLPHTMEQFRFLPVEIELKPKVV